MIAEGEISDWVQGAFRRKRRITGRVARTSKDTRGNWTAYIVGDSRGWRRIFGADRLQLAERLKHYGFESPVND